jgi:glycosyltransferase involved in cell wall biosynthesis
MDLKGTLLSIVIPVFNEEDNITLIHKRLAELLNGVIQHEIIFVNDGSKDNSLSVIKDISVTSKNIKFINLTRNFGHQAALTAGMDFAAGDIVVTMDCDMQDPPELILKMIEKWKEGALVVYTRRKQRHESFLKKYSARTYYSVLRSVSEFNEGEDIGDFRLIDKKVLAELKKMHEKSRYLRGMISWLGFNYVVVDYDRPLRVHGKTGFSLVKMIRLAMDGILSFSLLPLQLGFVIGVLCIIVGLIFLGYISYDALINHVDYPLYKWLVIALFLLLGFMFILMWIVAEYIGRIFNETKGRPIYVILNTGNINAE